LQEKIQIFEYTPRYQLFYSKTADLLVLPDRVCLKETEKIAFKWPGGYLTPD